MLTIRESSGVGVNLTWLIPRKVFSLSSTLSFFCLFPARATARDKKKNREPGQPRVRLKTPAGSFARRYRVGERERVAAQALVFSLPVAVRFALVLIFIHGGKNCAAPSNFREIIAAR